jgi:membrane protein
MTDPMDARRPRPAPPTAPAAIRSASSPAEPVPAGTAPRQTDPSQPTHDSGAPSRAPSWPRTVRVKGLASAWRSASEVFRSTRSRLEHTLPGRIWTQLGELGFIDSSLQFAALFTLSFIPFLMLLSVVLGRDLPRALVARSEFSAEARHDVTALFTHGRTALTSLSIIGIVLVIFGAESVSRILQTWYAKIFRAEIHGWKAFARRAEWLAGVFGFVALQFVIGRRLQPHIGHIMASGAQFLLAITFWWWSLHCLLVGQITWRRLFPSGLVTAICYTVVGIYVAFFGSSSILSNEASYGPIGAVMTLLTIEVGLGVALHLGAVIGATIGGKATDGPPGTSAARPRPMRGHSTGSTD